MLPTSLVPKLLKEEPMTLETKSAHAVDAPPLRFLSVVLAALALVSVVGCGGGGSSKPGSSGATGDVLTPGDAILGYVTMPDLDAALGVIGEIVGAFNPQLATRERLREQLGANFGDPGLKQLDVTKPLLIVALRGKNPLPVPAPPVAVALPVTSAESTYAAALSAQGMKTKYVDGLLVGAQTDIELAAPAVRTLYAEIERAKIGATGRFYVHAGRALEEHGEVVDTFTANALQAVSSLGGLNEGLANVEGLLQLEIGAVAVVSKQVEEMQVDLGLTADALDLGTVVKARAGTSLAKLFGANEAMRAEISDLVSDEAAVRAAYGFSGSSFLEFTDATYAEIAKDPELGASVKTPIAKILRELMSMYEGGASFAIDMAEDGSAHWESVIDYRGSEDELLANLGGYLELFTGTLLAGDSSPGTSTIERDTREHAGAKVHRMGFDWASPEEMPDFPGFPTSFELALVGDKVVWAGIPARLDDMIDRVKAGDVGTGAPLRAEKRYGKGRQAYMDYDFIRLMKGLMNAAEATIPGVSERMAELDSGEPMMVAGSFASDRAEFLFTMPLGAVREIAEMGKPSSRR